MPALQVVHPPGYREERAYAARVLLRDFLGLEAEVVEGPVEDWELRAGEAGLTVADVLFRTPQADWLTPRALPATPLERWEGSPLGGMPVLYGRPPYLEEGRLGLDVFGGAFLLLTRYEEAVLPERDAHERFPAQASLAVREGFLERPLVNEYAEVLWWALERAFPGLERRRPSFRLVPSHDVDWPRVPRHGLLRHGLLRRALGETTRRGPEALRLLGAVAGRDPFDTFDALMEASERRGVRAAFYFIAGHGVPADGDYSLDDPWIRALLRRIHGRGHEIGLHASYLTFRDPERLRAELDALRGACEEEDIAQEAFGGRQHFLRWEPATWTAWEEAGLAYDSTLTFSARPGFRCGACTEYAAFDLQGRRELRLRERPLVLMDTPTLDGVDLADEELEVLIGDLRDQCRRFGGDFTVLWHNNWLVTRRQRRLLETALGPADT